MATNYQFNEVLISFVSSTISLRSLPWVDVRLLVIDGFLGVCIGQFA